ncbi:MAG: ABC transporter permease [Proteobacteria bacterium]|nr:ABC transporter permease [Pseudomonadota bacterium]MBI3498072.1 ABC transporter permease [Pseudomonadota bacterium]
MSRRSVNDGLLGALPFAALILAWLAAPHLIVYPPYMLPSIGAIGERLLQALGDNSLVNHTMTSLGRLLLGFLIGNAIAIPLGIAIALNRHVADLLMPLLTFLQSIAGIAWIPLAIIWFGIGNGAIVFVIANIIFFSVIYNTVIGVQTIPVSLRRAVLSHGGSGLQLLTELIVPGALMQIILGLRTSVALGWRALVAGEMLAGASGLGYMTLEAVQWYKTDTVILGMLLIGLLWLLIDRFVFTPLERITVIRWGLVQR